MTTRKISSGFKCLFPVFVVVLMTACGKQNQTCQKFVLYQQQKVDVEGLKAAITNSKIPINVDIGSVKIEPEKLRESSEAIQQLDLAQFSACQAMMALPEGPARAEASVRWSNALIGLVKVLSGSKEPSYSLRIDGREDGVRGRNVQLKLGLVPADVTSSYRLLVTALADSVRLKAEGRDAGISWQWTSGNSTEDITKAAATPLQIRVESPSVGPERVALVHLVDVNESSSDVTIAVKYEALAPIAAASNALEQMSGNGQDFSAPATVCVARPPRGDYAVDRTSIAMSMTGDRKCNEYSTCQVNVDSDGSRACLIFTLQGHNECGGDCAHRVSTGHISATFRLTASAPAMVANAF